MENNDKPNLDQRYFTLGENIDARSIIASWWYPKVPNLCMIKSMLESLGSLTIDGLTTWRSTAPEYQKPPK